MKYYDFDTSDYAMFSMGEIQDDTAFFAKSYSSPLSERLAGKAPTGQVKAHVRKTPGGKWSFVRGGFRKIKEAALKRGGQAVGLGREYGGKAVGLGREYGGKAVGLGREYGGKAVGLGREYGGKAVNVVKKNPKAAGVAAVVGGGAYVLGSRKKRRR